jgi:hypothetical protein
MQDFLLFFDDFIRLFWTVINYYTLITTILLQYRYSAQLVITSWGLACTATASSTRLKVITSMIAECDMTIEALSIPSTIYQFHDQISLSTMGGTQNRWFNRICIMWLSDLLGFAATETSSQSAFWHLSVQRWYRSWKIWGFIVQKITKVCRVWSSFLVMATWWFVLNQTHVFGRLLIFVWAIQIHQ